MIAAPPLRAAARAMSTATEEEARHQMIRWTKISLAMLMASAGYTAVQFLAHEDDHHHHHQDHGDGDGDAPKYSYLKLRNKPYPWHFSNCDLLDFRCKKLARAAEQALKKQ